jgi:hypothetical protein
LCEATGEDLALIAEALEGARAWVHNAEALEKLATAVLNGLQPAVWETRAAAFDALDDVLRRRKSDLRSLPSTASEKWLLEGLLPNEAGGYS